MKYLYLALIVILISSCSNKGNETTVKNDLNKDEESKIDEADVAEVYYFHGTRRCETCKAVGRVAKGYTLLNYKDEIEKGKVKVIEIDYDQAGNEELVNKFKVSRSSLIVRTVKDKLEEVTDLTEMAFLNADLHPEKIREAIKEKIDPIVNQ